MIHLVEDMTSTAWAAEQGMTEHGVVVAAAYLVKCVGAPCEERDEHHAKGYSHRGQT